MTAKQAKKLKVGDRVNWVSGGNGCVADSGTVCLDDRYDSLFVLWDNPMSGQRTYLHDTPALQYMEVPK